MAIKLINEQYCPAEDKNICTFICDTAADAPNLQAEYPNCCCGSSALVIDTGDVYMVNTSGKWVVFGG